MLWTAGLKKPLPHRVRIIGSVDRPFQEVTHLAVWPRIVEITGETMSRGATGWRAHQLTLGLMQALLCREFNSAGVVTLYTVYTHGC